MVKRIFISQEDLYRKYITENLSGIDTAKYFNCSVATINIFLRKHKIAKPKLVISREDLYRKYLEEGKTLDIIAEEFNCSYTTVVNYIRKFKITKTRKQVTKEINERLLEKYGIQNISQLPDVQEKIRQNNLRKYGVTSTSKLESVKNKCKHTVLHKYGALNVYASEYGKEKIKQTMLSRYGAAHALQIQEFKDKLNHIHIQNKRYKTLKKNKTFNASTPEKILYEKLLQKYSNVIKQYKSEEYPWNCDFYIPSKKLYIELQRHWTHGKEAFDNTNENHLCILEKWKEKSKTSKFYKNAIKVWTESDVRKRSWAYAHNLNFLEIF